MNPLRILFERKQLVNNLVARDLKGRYKGSVLGFLWILITPLLMACIYTFFMRLLAGRMVSVEEILIGVFAWQFTAQCVNDGLNSITGNANLVKKVMFPRFILPVASTTANLINYLLTLIIQFILVFILLSSRGESFTAWVWIYPLLIAYHLILNLGVVMFLAGLNVCFRDIQHLSGIFLTAWFFLSPAMYSIKFVEAMAENHPWLMDVYMLNPLAPLISCYRLIIPGAMITFTPYVIAGLVWPVVFLFISFGIFQRIQKNFSDWL